jgi:CO dehydrogenase maturation factor
MAIVHIMLQKKGGVGKSMTASMWMQYLDEIGYPVIGIDTDPSNKSFAEFAELGVSKLEILDANDEIDPRRFDVLVETICGLESNDHIVVDTGASCYPSLFPYLKHNGPFDIIKEAGHQIYVHTLISGGSDVIATTACLEELVTTFPDLPFIIWKNRYHGDLIIDDKPFEQFKVYPKIKKHLVAEIDIPKKNVATFGKDVELLMAKKHTFRAAINSSMPVMVRQRLKIFWNEARESMKCALIFGEPMPAAQEA